MLARIRTFFIQHPAMEVDTPALSTAGVTDPNISSLSVLVAEGKKLLHTSPEFPMKRLLAAGSGDIYQIAKVFRNGEQGRVHNPEFSLLEWYRLGMDHHDLMQELDALLMSLAPDDKSKTSIKLSYSEAIEEATTYKLENLNIKIIERILHDADVVAPISMGKNLDTWLDLLLTVVVAPKFKTDRFTFLYDYPASQAALAKICSSNPLVAERFEVYFGELELANGFHELQNATEQLSRFESEIEERREKELPIIPIDKHLVDALESGLPDCAGVAVGLDRLLMVLCDKTSIDEVLSFSHDRS